MKKLLLVASGVVAGGSIGFYIGYMIATKRIMKKAQQSADEQVESVKKELKAYYEEKENKKGKHIELPKNKPAEVVEAKKEARPARKQQHTTTTVEQKNDRVPQPSKPVQVGPTKVSKSKYNSLDGLTNIDSYELIAFMGGKDICVCYDSYDCVYDEVDDYDLELFLPKNYKEILMKEENRSKLYFANEAEETVVSVVVDYRTRQDMLEDQGLSFEDGDDD